MTPSKKSRPGNRSGKTKKQDLVTRFRIDAIMAATRKVIEEDGPRFTLERIAEEAEVAKGTLYLYFSSKDDLVFRVLKESMGSLVEQNSRTMEREAPFAVRLRELVESQIEFVDLNSKIFLHYHLQKGSSHHATRKDLQRRMKEEFDRYIDMLSSHLERAMGSGEVRPSPPRKLALILSGMVDSVLVNRILFDSSESRKEEADFIMDLLFHGITPSTKREKRD